MARSIKKGPYAEERLLERIDGMNARNEKKIIKTWSRRSTIFPQMVGHKLGEFALTRTYKGHAGRTERSSRVR